VRGYVLAVASATRDVCDASGVGDAASGVGDADGQLSTDATLPTEYSVSSRTITRVGSRCVPRNPPGYECDEPRILAALNSLSCIMWNLSQLSLAMPSASTDMHASNDWSKTMSSRVYEWRAWKLFDECGSIPSTMTTTSISDAARCSLMRRRISSSWAVVAALPVAALPLGETPGPDSSATRRAPAWGREDGLKLGQEATRAGGLGGPARADGLGGVSGSREGRALIVLQAATAGAGSALLGSTSGSSSIDIPTEASSTTTAAGDGEASAGGGGLMVGGAAAAAAAAAAVAIRLDGGRACLGITPLDCLERPGLGELQQLGEGVDCREDLDGRPTTPSSATATSRSASRKTRPGKVRGAVVQIVRRRLTRRCGEHR